MSLAVSLKRGGALILILQNQHICFHIRHAACAHVHLHEAHKINEEIKYRESEPFYVRVNCRWSWRFEDTDEVPLEHGLHKTTKRCVLCILGSKTETPKSYPQLKGFAALGVAFGAKQGMFSERLGAP